MSSIVNEVRVKSPAVVQKWIEATSNDTTEVSSGPLESSDAIEVESSASRPLDGIENRESSAESKETPQQQTDSPIKVWIAAAFSSRTNSKEQEEADAVADSEAEPGGTALASVLNRAKLSEFYNRLSINKKRYSFIKDRRMAAKQIIQETRERLAQSGAAEERSEKCDISDSERESASSCVATEHESEKVMACDSAIELDTSTDELSHFSHSNDNMSAVDSYNLSTQSMADAGAPSLLNVRKVGIGEIGRSTSDNPRVKNKMNLGDIGRSFSEQQDDEAIVLIERNISAPTSSVAIPNNQRQRNLLERRAYSVSPTQRTLRRGILTREQSLCEMSSQRSILRKDNSFQSDSSHCSSVESLLDARKPDPEAILRHLGFGPVQEEDLLSRIPKR